MCSSLTTHLQNAVSHSDGTSSETHHPTLPSSPANEDPKLRNHLPVPRFPVPHTGHVQHCFCKIAGMCTEKSWDYKQPFCSKPRWQPLPCPLGGILPVSPAMGCGRDLACEKAGKQLQPSLFAAASSRQVDFSGEACEQCSNPSGDHGSAPPASCPGSQ